MKSKLVLDFLDVLTREIAAAPIADALALARLYGNLAWNNPVERYGADDIEAALYARIAPLRQAVLEQAPARKNGRLLHVLTEGYDSGGHTRVLERLLGAGAGLPGQDVVIVDTCPPAVMATLAGLAGTVRRVDATGLQAIPVLAAMIAEYELVLLHIHPDDILSSLCARIGRDAGSKVALYNHADHCFTYGAPAIDILCEISAFGDKISRQYRPGLARSFAGIALQIGAVLARPPAPADMVLSSGPAYKFDFSEGGVYAKMVEGIVSGLGLSMVIIGPTHLPADAAASLVRLVDSGQLVLLPPMAYHDYVERLRDCTCYLDSAPLSGGSALPEAALYGIPCAGLVNAVMGYSPIDSVRSGTLEDLLARIGAIRSAGPHVALPERDALVAVHAPQAVLGRIVDSLRGAQRLPVPFRIADAALDIRFPHQQWCKDPVISLHTRAFDWISLTQRVKLLMLMWRGGIVQRMRPLAALKLFASTIRTRRWRNS